MAAPPGPRVSAAQTTLLVEFMEQHPYLARGATSLSPSMSAAHKKALWNELTAALNALGPAVKTARRWRQYWARIVHDLKKLAAQVGSERRKTGGGRLGGLEGRVLDVLSRTGPGYAPVDFFPDDAEHHQQLVEEQRASRVVQQQLVVETRGLREATALVAATLRQLVAALARGLREPPQP
ncbi:hypothetical protein HPB49_019199 [Dermacentor silvarum]|uniref:Uncharacterized protein n=2 Tax=Dermacentor silvarum TaxID=543639 RepID=A0ACB8CT10_DERSI|nr:hypothetical protein HPB49_001171 [Dermacentor silvarum]KAH7950063.1 hypothetical protein HPB49_019199 [Dermacentor silvarum]